MLVSSKCVWSYTLKITSNDLAINGIFWMVCKKRIKQNVFSKNWYRVLLLACFAGRTENSLMKQDIPSCTILVIGLSISISINLFLISCGILLCRYCYLPLYKNQNFIIVKPKWVLVSHSLNLKYYFLSEFASSFCFYYIEMYKTMKSFIEPIFTYNLSIFLIFYITG